MSARRWTTFWALVALVLPTTSRLSAQDINLLLPTDSIEFLYSTAAFEPDTLVGTRFEGDRTQRTNLIFEDGTVLFTKWALAPRGGGCAVTSPCSDDEFNNSPRYEVAAYVVQKLFLDEPEYVVPPTVPRVVPLEWYRTVDDRMDATFGDIESVLVVLQAMLNRVSTEDVFDLDRFDADSAYARNWANLNLFTHLIWHSDSNEGNLLISQSTRNPRIFSVDNGVAFGSEVSNRGTRWRSLQVDRFPAATVERLRAITEEQIHDVLGVLAQWEIVDGEMVPAAPTENLWEERGVREEDGVIQIGLTYDEIDEIWDRVEAFLGRVDSGRFSTF